MLYWYTVIPNYVAGILNFLFCIKKTKTNPCCFIPVICLFPLYVPTIKDRKKMDCNLERAVWARAVWVTSTLWSESYSQVKHGVGYLAGTTGSWANPETRVNDSESKTGSGVTKVRVKWHIAFTLSLPFSVIFITDLLAAGLHHASMCIPIPTACI